MRPIPASIKKELSELPRMTICARAGDGHNCKGRITWEHCWIYQGKQINEVWAIIALCENSHLGVDLNKEINQWISINLATDEDFKKYPRKNWQQIKKYLNNKYKMHFDLQKVSKSGYDSEAVTFDEYAKKI